MTSLSPPAALVPGPADASASLGRDVGPAACVKPTAPRADIRMSAFERLARTLILWHHRSRSRAALKRLDDRLLHDIGLDRDTARRVAAKRFWQD